MTLLVEKVPVRCGSKVARLVGPGRCSVAIIYKFEFPRASRALCLRLRSRTAPRARGKARAAPPATCVSQDSLAVARAGRDYLSGPGWRCRRCAPARWPLGRGVAGEFKSGGDN